MGLESQHWCHFHFFPLAHCFLRLTYQTLSGSGDCSASVPHGYGICFHLRGRASSNIFFFEPRERLGVAEL